MEDKLKQLIKSYEECIEVYKDLGKKGDDYARGLNNGYTDSLSSVIKDLKSVLEGEEI